LVVVMTVVVVVGEWKREDGVEDSVKII